MDTLLKINNKYGFLQPLHGVSKELSGVRGTKFHGQEFEFGQRKSRLKLRKGIVLV